MIPQIVELVRKYDAQKHAFFMTTNDKIIRQVMEYAPDIPCCVGWDGNEDPMSMVERAIELGACKIQLYKLYFQAGTVKKPMITESCAMYSGQMIPKRQSSFWIWGLIPS